MYVCSDGKNIRSDSQRQPFSPMIPHGQEQVHTSWYSLQTTSRFYRKKEETSMEMSPTSTDVSAGNRSLLSVQKVSRSRYHKKESKTL